MNLNNKTKALVVLSGGQDSTTCLYIAKQEFDEVYAVSFDYGQKHKIELESARKIAEMAGVAHEIIDVRHVLESMSPLTTSAAILEKYDNATQMDEVIGNRVELTFVPMRNMLFLTIAANHAVALGCSHIYTGICQQDNANYPDCTENFRQLMEDTINISLGRNPFNPAEKLTIAAPLMYLSKAESVHLAHSMPLCWEALAYSHTSYDGVYPPTGKNHANVLRADGFEKAGLPDPLVLRAYTEGLMPLPETANYKDIHNA